MLDATFLVATVVFFVVAILYVRGCEYLRRAPGTELDSKLGRSKTRGSNGRG